MNRVINTFYRVNADVHAKDMVRGMGIVKAKAAAKNSVANTTSDHAEGMNKTFYTHKQLRTIHNFWVQVDNILEKVK